MAIETELSVPLFDWQSKQLRMMLENIIVEHMNNFHSFMLILLRYPNYDAGSVYHKTKLPSAVQ